MPTRNHPASVTDLDEALGTPGSLNASEKIAAVEEVFGIVLSGGNLASSGRSDRLRTAFKQRFAVIAAVARNRPADEFEQWLDRYFDESLTTKRSGQGRTPNEQRKGMPT